jgi:hypothetical protein
MLDKSSSPVKNSFAVYQISFMISNLLEHELTLKKTVTSRESRNLSFTNNSFNAEIAEDRLLRQIIHVDQSSFWMFLWKVIGWHVAQRMAHTFEILHACKFSVVSADSRQARAPGNPQDPHCGATRCQVDCLGINNSHENRSLTNDHDSASLCDTVEAPAS